MEPRDWAAFGALALSLANTGWQGWTAWRGRRRITVTVLVSNIATTQPDGTIRNEWFPMVSVRAISGPVGIDSVHLRWADKDCRDDLSTGPAGDNLPSPVHEHLPGKTWSPFTMHRVLDTGERADWMFRVTSTTHEGDTFRLVAVVTRTDGKVDESETFHLPRR